MALVGDVATLKSPIIDSIKLPFETIEMQMLADYGREMARWKELEPEEKKATEEPHAQRILLDDTTFAGAQNAMRYSTDGLICVRDELTGFFAAMDAFSKGSGVERPFWLQTYSGGRKRVDRADKGRTFIIPNCGVSFCGGIQPDTMRKVDAEATNDGLLQRMIAIILLAMLRDLDLPTPDVQAKYDALIMRLHALPRQHPPTLYTFTIDAVQVREKAFDWFLSTQLTCTHANQHKLAQHVGKYRGIFVRLCLIWHIVEGNTECNIDTRTAERVLEFMRCFLFPHAIHFYTDVLSVSSQQMALQSIASYILLHPNKNSVNSRDVMQSLRSLRGTTARDVAVLFDQLEAAGIVRRFQNRRVDSVEWVINPLFRPAFESATARAQKATQAWLDLRAGK